MFMGFTYVNWIQVIQYLCLMAVLGAIVFICGCKASEYCIKEEEKRKRLMQLRKNKKITSLGSLYDKSA